MAFFNKPKLPTIGLVLDGGGARGPYQIGVILAMRKYGLDKQVSCLSAASIGAFDSALFFYEDPQKMMDFWKKANNDVVLSQRENKVTALASAIVKKDGIYTREGIKDLIRSNIDLRNHFLNTPPVFFSLAQEVKDEKGKTIDYKKKYIQINGLPSEDILTLMLATSAIPYVFDPVEYKGQTYVDPMKADNEPVAPLLKLNPDYIFIVPLNNSHYNHVYDKDFSKPIIDFASPMMMELPKMNMIDFSDDMKEKYISEGYQVGKMLIEYILRKKFLAYPTQEDRQKRPQPYYSLHNMGIISLEFAKMEMKDIIEDVKRGNEL